MKTTLFKALTAFLIAGGLVNAAEPAAPEPAPSETKAQRDLRMGWWREAKFGLFIHWGLYSVPAGYYQGKPVSGIGEWIMNKGKIPMSDYQAFAKEFNPVKFNAETWVKAAKAAGMKYIVITSKHHDGFAMFDSKVNNWNIVKATPYKHDPLMDLAAACRKEGIRLGFYYSQAQDWNNGGSAAGGKWDKAQEHSMDDYIDQVAVPQIREILTNYGKDIPAVVWWDTPIDMSKPRADKIEQVIRELRPDLITNNRLGGGYAGDTETPEQYIPARGYPGRDWESCMTMNDTWGFKKDDQHWKSVQTLIRNLCDIASKGGNYLLNVGPTSEGEIPAASLERMAAVGEWMKINGESIYGTTSGPFLRLSWGRASQKSTASGTLLYLHVFDWPKEGKLVVPGLTSLPKAITLLASGQALKGRLVNKDLVIEVPASAPDANATVIRLEFAGAEPLAVEKRIPVQQSNGTISLPAEQADINNVLDSHAVLDKSAGSPTIKGWKNDHRITLDWVFELKTPGVYSIQAQYLAQTPSTADLKVNDKKVESVTFGVSPSLNKSVVIGNVTLTSPGETVLKISPLKPWAEVELQSLTLLPLK